MNINDAPNVREMPSFAGEAVGWWLKWSLERGCPGTNPRPQNCSCVDLGKLQAIVPPTGKTKQNKNNN